MASSLLELTPNQFWSTSGSARSAKPSTTPAANVTGMLWRRPTTAAAMLKMTTRVKTVESSVWARVTRMTPARPATVLDSIHATALTRSESTPASSTMRGLSTTARICNPVAVYRKITPRTITTTTVRIAAMVKSHATKWVPMLKPAELIPNIGGMLDRDVTGTGWRPVNTILVISGSATNRPSTETSFTCQPDVRIARNRIRSRANPTNGDTISTATMSPNARAARISCPNRTSRC